MRPLRLEMTAFGPFAGKEVVDFRELRGARLFLIHGDTGAGKSTILDGICTALYGVSAGGERTPEQLRSDHADPDVMTKLQLDFSIAGTCYRIERFPTQERPKVRGAGVTEEKASATLWRLASDLPGAAVVEVLAERKVREVGERIQRLIGFQAEQFRRVVVLPQGQFRQLLSASTDDREAILRALFDTAVFDRVENGLRQRSGTLKKEIGEGLAARSGLLSSEGVTTLDDLAAKIEGKVLAQRVLDAEAKEASDEAGARAKTLAVGEQRDGLFADRDSAQAGCTALAEQAVSVEAERLRYERAREAKGLVPAFEAGQAAAKKCEERAETKRTTAAAVESSLTAVANAQVAAKSAAEERAKRDERSKELTRLRGLLEIAKQWKRRNEVRVKAEGALEGTVGELATAERLRDDARATVAALDTALAELAQSPTELLQAEAAVQTADARLALHDKAATLAEKAQALEHALGVARVGCEDAEKELSTATATLRTLQDAMRLGRAASLAQGLQDGQPCPVCGSGEHPAPATSDAELPSDQDLKAAEEVVSGAQDAFTAAQSAVATALATLNAKREEEAAQLAILAGESPEDVQLKVQRAGELRNAALERVENKTKGEARRPGLASDEARAVEAYEAQRDAEREARNKLQGAQEEEAAALETLGGAPVDTDDLAVRADALDKLLRDADDAHDQAQEQLKKDEKEHASHVSAAGAAIEEHKLADQDLVSARAAWVEALKPSTFVDEADFVAAQLGDEELAAMETRVHDHDEQATKLQARLAALDTQLAGVERPNLDALRTAAAHSREESERAIKRQGEETSSLAQAQRVHKACETSQNKLAALEERYVVLEGLSKVANGSNAARITLHRFVLASFLDDVLLQASQHLMKTSGGRYTLVRRVTPGDARIGQGLDLDVHDHYTGEPRPATTLSGGEGFLAALALALGLADVVQAHSGGIHIETVFVDEGFGSLDAETLDLAVEALMELEKSGRMVGVISHVSELKERIDVQLEVTTGIGGSRTQFRVPS